MSFDLADVVPLSVTIRDADGSFADAGSVSLTVTLPDGTTSVTGPIASTTVGVYNHDYVTTQAGRHGVRWVATGVNASAFDDAFTVDAADPGAFVSLADVKAHMGKTDSGDDAELAGFVTAACRMIEERIGHVTPAAFTEDVRAREVVVLPERPVISVTSVATLPDLTAVPQADPTTSTAGWTLDGPAGLLKYTSRFGHVRVAYRAGRTPVPGNVRLAALELAAHLWRSSQMNSGGVRPLMTDSDAPIFPGSSYALPTRVRELLGLGKNPTSDILVG